jgi:hypothetical protein
MQRAKDEFLPAVDLLAYNAMKPCRSCQLASLTGMHHQKSRTERLEDATTLVIALYSRLPEALNDFHPSVLYSRVLRIQTEIQVLFNKTNPFQGRCHHVGDFSPFVGEIRQAADDSHSDPQRLERTYRLSVEHLHGMTKLKGAPRRLRIV